MNPAKLMILLGLVLLGALGLYALMLHPPRRRARMATLAMVCSLVALAVLGIRHLEIWHPQRLLFWCLAAPALWGAVRVVTHQRPVYCAAYFLMVVVAVAGELILADAEFVGAALVTIYAGAVLVTYVFVIMLAQQHVLAEYDRQAREPFAAVVVGFLLVCTLSQLLVEPGIAASAPGSPATVVGRGEPGPATPAAAVPAGGISASGIGALNPADADEQGPALAEAEEAGNVRSLAAVLLTRYAVAVEIVGVLLWVAIVGAIWLVGRRPPEVPAVPPTEGPLNQIGRIVPPF